MKYEDYAKFERARLEAAAQRRATPPPSPDRRAELLGQLVEALDAIEGRLSRELASELREELGRLVY